MASNQALIDWFKLWQIEYGQYSRLSNYAAFSPLSGRGIPPAVKELNNVWKLIQVAFKPTLDGLVNQFGGKECTTPADWLNRWLVIRAGLPGWLNAVGAGNTPAIISAFDAWYNKYIAPNISKLPKNLQP